MNVSEPHDRHAAHGVPDEDHRRTAYQLLQHLIQILCKLRNPAELRLRATRSAMRTQVVQHLAQLASEVQPLEVPAIQVQGVPMYEDQRDVISLALIYLGVQHDAVRSRDIRTVRAQREEAPEFCLGRTRYPL